MEEAGKIQGDKREAAIQAFRDKHGQLTSSAVKGLDGMGKII